MMTPFTRSSDDLILSWQLRLKQQLKADNISYRELASRMKTNDAIISNHLNDKNRQESLTFIKRVCKATGYRLQWVLFGTTDDTHQVMVPWLNRLGIKQWLDEGNPTQSHVKARHIHGWFSFPDTIQISSNGFIWQVQSSELKPFGMTAGSWLLVDPARQILKRKGMEPVYSVGEPLVLVRLRSTNGLMVCKMQTIADQVWFLPPSGHTSAFRQEDLEILGKIIAGLRNFDDHV